MNQKQIEKQYQMISLFEERYSRLPFEDKELPPPQEEGWAVVFVEAQKPIPEHWRNAFYDELFSENLVYRRELEESVRWFGVRFK